MDLFIVIIIVIGAVFFSIRGFVKIFKGEKTCGCGSGCGCTAKDTCASAKNNKIIS